VPWLAKTAAPDRIQQAVANPRDLRHFRHVVDAPNYMGAPTSLEHARGFYHATNPGMFFRWLVPATQLFLLLALVVNWKPAPGTRWKLAGALVFLVLTDMITFRFHYPRNDILFVAPLTQPAAYYDRVVRDQLKALRALLERDGVPIAEPIRRGVDLWLEKKKK